MKILRGYAAARTMLSQRSAGSHLKPSAELGDRLRVSFGEEISVEEAVDRIIEDVRDRGDEAVLEYSKRFDGADFSSMEVSREETVEAHKNVPAKLLQALGYAAEQVRNYHLSYGETLGLRLNTQGVGTFVRPLNRVGVYVPGGRACYPSTVLMTVVPAKAAGVREVVLCTPPGKDGRLPAATLAAAEIAGADRIFKVGGAQAIAAMAFGTETIPPVDKICGPGNIFVTLAKKRVFGAVGIDGLQGPSELVILADGTSNPAYCAADLLAQGEHDPLAAAVLVTTSEAVAQSVEREVLSQAANLSRNAILAQSVVKNGVLVIVDSMAEAIKVVNEYAPEHVSLAVDDATAYLDQLQNAGCIFLGHNCPPALGDFVAGPSHVLPTGGTARYGSPLGITDFLKRTSIIAPGGVTQETSSVACAIAEAEGFDAHCRSLELRVKRHDR